MKLLIKLFVCTFLLSLNSCYAQKMVQKSSDAKKLEINKDQFIDKPLKVLLAQIAPKIEGALGDPDMASDTRLNHISFCFIGIDEYFHRKNKGENPIIIRVTLKRPNRKEYPVLSPKNAWTDEQTKIYGDMIVMRITVSGEN